MEDGVGVGGNVLERPPTELDAASRFFWELKSRKKSKRPKKKSEEEEEEEEEEASTKNRLLVILLLHSRRRRCLLCSIFMDKYKYKQLQVFLDK